MRYCGCHFESTFGPVSPICLVRTVLGNSMANKSWLIKRHCYHGSGVARSSFMGGGLDLEGTFIGNIQGILYKRTPFHS